MKLWPWTTGILLYGLIFTLISTLDLSAWTNVALEFIFWLFVLIFVGKKAFKYFGKWSLAAVGNLLFIIPIVYVLLFRTASEIKVGDVLLCISAVLGEELAFRLFFPWFLAEKFHIRSIGTVIISSLIFGVFHAVNILSGIEPAYLICQILYASCIGFGLCMFVCETTSLLPCVILHTLLNIFPAKATSVTAIICYTAAAILFVGYGIFICIAETNTKGSKAYYETIH